MQSAEAHFSSTGLEDEIEIPQESSPEVVELSAVKYFSLALQNAQRQALVTEGPKKRVHTAQGKSDRTIQRHKRAKMQMEAKGFLSLPEFLKQKAEKAKQQGSIEADAEAAEVEVEGMGYASKAPRTASERALTLQPASTEPEPASAASVVAKITLELLEVPRASTAAVMALREEEEEEEEEEEAPTVIVAPTSAIAVTVAVAEEEEEDEDEEEVSNTRSTKTSMHTPSDSSSDLGDIRQSSWGPSRTILYSSSEGSMSSSNSNTQSDPKDLQGTNTWELEGLHHRDTHDNDTTQHPMDSTTKLLEDRAELQVVHRELSLMARQKSLDAVLHSCVVAMVGLLNLYLDGTLGHSWRRASEIAAKLEGRGTRRAQSVRGWVLNFVHTRGLPTHRLGRRRLTALDNEEITHNLKLALGERAKNGFLTASDIIDIVSSLEMQAHFARARIDKTSVLERTARRWLSKLGWRCGRHKGMYVDGHEHSDVVEYRQAFVERFQNYERWFHTWDNSGNKLLHPSPAATGPLRLVLVTHDESMFYQNDQQQIHWGCPGSETPKAKGEGVSLMVSDFLTADWGYLHDDNRCVVASLVL